MSQKSAKHDRKKAGRPRGLPDIPIDPKNGAKPQEIQESLMVPAALANVIFEYMKKRPWDEAQPIIGGLLRCEKLKE